MGRALAAVCVMGSSESQPEGADASGISSQERWCSCRYSLKQRKIYNISVPVCRYAHRTRAHRLGLLRGSGFNKIADEGDLEGSNPNVNFPASCECLLTLTLNPLEPGTTILTQSQGKPHTWVSTRAVCILASTVSTIYFQFIDAYRLKRRI